MLFFKLFFCFFVVYIEKMVSSENFFDVLSEFLKVIDEMSNIVLVLY